MAAYDAFYPYTRIHVSEAPEPLLLTAVRDTCIEFCRETLWLQQDMDAMSVQAGNAVYEIDVPTGYRLLQLMSLFYDGRRLYPFSPLAADAGSATDWQQLSGAPVYYAMLTPSELTLVPTPDATVASAITGRMALAPTRTSTEVDDSLYEWFVEDIANGAAGKLMLVDGYKFSNPQNASIKLAMFRAAINKARIMVNAGRVAAPMMVQTQ